MLSFSRGTGSGPDRAKSAFVLLENGTSAAGTVCNLAHRDKYSLASATFS